MKNFEEAKLEFTEALNELLPELESRYKKVEAYAHSIKCHEGDCDFKQIRVIEDNERRNPKFPMTSRQYQLEGGHRELGRKMASKDSGAWKVEIKCYSNGQNYEVAPTPSGSLWSKESFINQIRDLFLR